MKNYYSLTLAMITLLVNVVFTASAQTDHCATMSHLNTSLQQDQSLQQRLVDNEATVQRWIHQNERRPARRVITITVVFHIIHNGEAIGVGNNVADSIIAYQLSRINEDFRKLNADTLKAGHPFYTDQADAEIEFCLAKRDPNGNASTGINRYARNRESWTIQQIDDLIKPGTIWNPKDYLNIWSVNLVDDDSPGVDGYATFPAEATETNDGVVVATFAFGYQKGRTKSIVATHELGHYFNLLHIWGDDDCGNDLVADTPTAKKDNEGCPTFPHNVNSSCSPGPKGEMFMNYMDYSDAACVVMFSQGQKARMQATLATLRASLTRSMGCSAAGSTGVRNVASGPALKISPNPSVGTFRISSVESTLAVTSISVYNQLGGLVSQLDQVNGLPQEINLQDMPDGVYVVRVSSPAGVSSQIIVKAH